MADPPVLAPIDEAAAEVGVSRRTIWMIAAARSTAIAAGDRRTFVDLAALREAVAFKKT
jgi:hypothetical protein